MHTVQLGLIKLPAHIEDADMSVKEAVIADYVFELNKNEGNSWSDWCSVGGRWDNFLQDPQFTKSIWPNSSEYTNLMPINEDTIGILIECLQWAIKNINEELKRCVAGFKDNDFLDVLFSEKDLNLLEVIHGDAVEFNKYWKQLYSMRSITRVFSDEWGPESNFFFANVVKSNGDIWTEVQFNPLKVLNLIDNDKDGSYLDYLKDYHLVVVDFHF